MGGLSGVAVPSGGTAGDGSNVRRLVTRGFQDKLFRASSINSATEASAGDGGVQAGGGFNNNDAAAQQRQEQGLSLSNPRAFEMVAADMGHLKDTVSCVFIKLYPSCMNTEMYRYEKPSPADCFPNQTL